MDNLSKVFEKKINQYGIKKQIDAAMVCEAFDSAIVEIFGETGQKNVKAISYKDNILKVGVTSSSWASEINLKRLEVSKNIEARIIFWVGDIKQLETF